MTTHEDFLAELNAILDKKLNKEQTQAQIDAAVKRFENTWSPEERGRRDLIPAIVSAQLDKLGWREFERRLVADGADQFIPQDVGFSPEWAKLIFITAAQEAIKKAKAIDL